MSKSRISDSPVSVRLICPRCRKQTTRKWNQDKSPYGFGWCRRCIPREPVIRYEPPHSARTRARTQAQVKVADV